ncbi:MAG: hypothetical protein PVH68_01560 [Armatimonadota bacterium]|jgi:transposase-like protein
MKQDITPEGRTQRVTWETLEGYIRERAQELIQELLEEEVTELLGRGKSERRALVDAAPGYRNGHTSTHLLTGARVPSVDGPGRLDCYGRAVMPILISSLSISLSG